MFALARSADQHRDRLHERTLPPFCSEPAFSCMHTFTSAPVQLNTPGAVASTMGAPGRYHRIEARCGPRCSSRSSTRGRAGGFYHGYRRALPGHLEPAPRPGRAPALLRRSRHPSRRPAQPLSIRPRSSARRCWPSLILACLSPVFRLLIPPRLLRNLRPAL